MSQTPTVRVLHRHGRRSALRGQEEAKPPLPAATTSGRYPGVPVSIKDLLYVKDTRITFGSKLFEIA